MNQIAASGQMVLTGPGQENAAAAGSTDESQQTRAILHAELLRLESQDRLELRLNDAFLVESCGKNGFSPRKLLHPRRMPINEWYEG